MNVVNTSRESWEDYADLVHAWGIEEADADSFTIPCGSHRLTVTIPGGLTPTHYEFFGSLSEEAKPTLAVGVLRNLLRTSIDWEHILAQEYGLDVLEHLPAMVEEFGFPAMAEFVRRKVIEYRKKNSPACMYFSVVRSPRWYAPMLCLGEKRWHFRDQDGPTKSLLDALEAGRDRDSGCWPPSVRLDDLDPDQVTQAAKYLRNKTGSHLRWFSAADGCLSWSLKR